MSHSTVKPSPDEQIRTITALLLEQLRGKLEELRRTNPEAITGILEKEAGLRKEEIKNLLREQIASHLSTGGLPFRVKDQVPRDVAAKGDTLLQGDWAIYIEGFTKSLDEEGLFGNPDAGYLFRNTSATVDPTMILGNGCFRHRTACEPVDTMLTFLFSGNAGTVLFNYTRDPGAIPYAVVSATTERENTLGQNPTWSYAFRKPALTIVPPATLALHLATLPADGGGTVLDKVRTNFAGATDGERVAACLGGIFTFQTNTGTLPCACAAFVSNQGAQEHILLNAVNFTPGSDLCRWAGNDSTRPYRMRWKLLSRWPDYKRLVEDKKLPL